MPLTKLSETKVLIVGQGLAGSALAWQLHRKGVSFVVVDRGGIDLAGRPCASRIAAGLVTPITGKRLTLDPRWQEFRNSAAELYRYAEQELQAEFYEEKPSLRLLASSDEHEQFIRKLCSPEYAQQACLADAAELPPSLGNEFGAFWMTQAARLHVDRFVQLTREWLERTERITTASLSAGEVECAAGGVVAPSLGLRAERIVYCQGACPPEELPAECPSVTADKGELLLVESPSLHMNFVAHRGVWVAPQPFLGPSRYLVGSTYAWGQGDSEPTPEARDSILARLTQLTSAEVTVISQAAAPRPAGQNRVPMAGFSVSQPRLGWFNGLGAKGVLWAPTYAARLAELCR